MEIEPCRVCQEDCAYVETEGGIWVYVECPNCGSHTVAISFKDDQEKKEAEEKAIMLWNMGKIIAEGSGV